MSFVKKIPLSGRLAAFAVGALGVTFAATNHLTERQEKCFRLEVEGSPNLDDDILLFPSLYAALTKFREILYTKRVHKAYGILERGVMRMVKDIISLMEISESPAAQKQIWRAPTNFCEHHVYLMKCLDRFLDIAGEPRKEDDELPSSVYLGVAPPVNPVLKEAFKELVTELHAPTRNSWSLEKEHNAVVASVHDDPWDLYQIAKGSIGLTDGVEDFLPREEKVVRAWGARW